MVKNRAQSCPQCCQMAKFDPFLSLDCASPSSPKGKNPTIGYSHQATVVAQALSWPTTSNSDRVNVNYP